MKAWELIEQLQGRDPSGEVVLTLSGDGFKYAANFDLSPPAHRRVILETGAEDIGVDTTELEDEIASLKAMVDDLQSALQKLMFAHDRVLREDTPENLAAVLEAQAGAREISTRSYP